MRPRISGDGADMTLVRLGPSPAALVADETRPPSLSAGAVQAADGLDAGVSVGNVVAAD